MTATKYSAPPHLQLLLNEYRHSRLQFLSAAARGVWLELITLAGVTNEIDRVRDDMRWLMKETNLPKKVIESALVELADEGSITRVDGWIVIYKALEAQDALLRKRRQNRANVAAWREREKAEKAGRKADVVTTTAATESDVAGGDDPITATQMARTVTETCEQSSGTIGEYLGIVEITQATATAANEAGIGSDRLTGHLTNTVIAAAAKRYWDGRITGKQLPSLYLLAGQIGVEHVIWSLVDQASVSDLDEGKECRYVLKCARNHAAEMALAS